MANLSSKILNSFSKLLPAPIKVMRPIHWTKNLSLFAALVFSGKLFVTGLFLKVFWAFLVFNLAASTTYIFNDILDANRDRLHPIKKFRPIASGKLSLTSAWLQVIILAIVALFLANYLSYVFFLLVASYLALQIAYSLFLKHIPIIDILIIATGFIIRIYSGAFVIDVHLSVWFLLCVVSVALFLASGKRRAELGLVTLKTRKSLNKYSKDLLNSYVTMFGNAAWLSWSLFTFFESPKAALPIWLFLAELSQTTTINKLLMSTIPVAIFCIMRYEKLIFEEQTEAPEKLLLTDYPLIISVTLWTFMVVLILYAGVSAPYS